jgi:hypothetical protein
LATHAVGRHSAIAELVGDPPAPELGRLAHGWPFSIASAASHQRYQAAMSMSQKSSARPPACDASRYEFDSTRVAELARHTA